MGIFGNLIGQGLGALGSKLLPIPGVDGRALGGFLGGLAPFKNGGRVRLMPVNYNKGGHVVLKPMKRGGKVKRLKAVKKRKQIN